MCKSKEIWYKDMIAVYDEEHDIWGIFKMNTPQTVDNLLCVVHGPSRDDAREEMVKLYDARFPGRKTALQNGNKK